MAIVKHFLVIQGKGSSGKAEVHGNLTRLSFLSSRTQCKRVPYTF